MLVARGGYRDRRSFEHLPIVRSVIRQASATLLGGFVLMAVIGLCSLVSVNSAGAQLGRGSISSLRVEASDLASQILAEGVQIHLLSLQYASAQARLVHVQAQLASDEAALGSAERTLAVRQRQLRRTAVDTYIMEGQSVAVLGGLQLGSVNEEITREEYLTAATGSLSSDIERVHQATIVLDARAKQLRATEGADTLAVNKLVEERQKVADAAAQEQTLLNRVKGQLAVLVAQAEQARLLAAEQAAAEQAAQSASMVQGGTPAQPPPLPEGPPVAVSTGTVTQSSSLSNDFAKLRECESGDNYAADTGNGYYGAYQFSLATWQALGYSGLPSQAPPAVQDQAARRLQAEYGWGQWPACSAMLGL